VDNLTSYKLTLLFIFAIVVPSTLLSIISVAAISHERDLHHAQIVQRYREGTDEVAGALEKRLFGPEAELERALAALAAGDRPALRDYAAPLRALAGAGRLFRAAALVEPGGTLVAATPAVREPDGAGAAFASLAARDDAGGPARALEELQKIRAEVAAHGGGETAEGRADREAGRAFAAALQAGPTLYPRLKAIAARRELGASGTLVERAAGDVRTVVFWSAIPRGAAPLGLAVFDVDVEGLRARELEPLVAGETVHDEGFFRLAEHGAPPGPADPGAEELGRRQLRAPLDTLDVIAMRRDPMARDPLGRLRDRVYTWAIALALLGLAIGAFVMTRTVRKEMKASALKSDFVTTVTHELKTPLTSIGMFAETLLMGRVRDKAEEKECLEIIAKETDRLTRLIDRVLTFSKIEARKKRFDLKLTDLAHLVEETLEIFKTQMRGAPRPFSVELTAVQDLPKVLMDRHSIQEVLLNLLSNAYKYGGEPRRIEVTMTKRRRWVLVEVRDWGIGIPWREQRKIFRKFYRANDVLTRDVEGSGIGLTLARSIAQAHRGDITVKSKVGQGSTFTVWLPR
jgi:signal transduction histidine kinase